MTVCDVTLEPSFVVAPVPPRIFGTLVEHMGRCVYGGVFEPGHPTADGTGLRADVLELTRELGVTVARYPGGNFVSSYEWEDGVGPVATRPTRLELAWRQLEPNTFGLNEFMTWARRADVEPMMVVNLGTRGVADACNLIEYTNFAGGTKYSDMRIAHGARDPYGIKLWSLGNEQDGPWQVAQKSAVEYGLAAAETAKAMKRIDPSIEVVSCASAWRFLPTMGSWQATVLEHAYEYVDYVSVHAYFEPIEGDQAGYLASGLVMENLIEAAIATSDHVGAKQRSKKKLNVAFDEWNLWYESRFNIDDHYADRSLEWEVAPRLIEDTYTVEDAVAFAGMLMSLLRHSDRVTVACLSELVNVIAPIRAEPGTAAWRQTIFHPFAQMARYARGDVLRVEPRVGTLHSPTYGDIPAVDVLATREPERGEVAVFVVNRQDQPATLRATLGALPEMSVVAHVTLGGGALSNTNTETAPNRCVPVDSDAHKIVDGRLEAQLPPVSWTMLRLVPTAVLATVDPR
ncbi:alpha-N-arabinofuranosidase [Micromonospora sp. NPDC051141]|uniref:arabinosylfuranosidase ArfA n=1 Tax=Micromonospora sp. NPDC051141 TaxID=3364284 RepID=UPI0037A5FF5D